MSNKPTVEERENGPLVVKGLASMRDADGAELDCKPVMVLCRCGHSSNKPFCDGSHKTAGFQSRGGEPAGPDRQIDYAGTEVTVSYNPRLCGHAAECGRIAGHVFDPAQKPWVQPDKGKLSEIEAVIAACPSGALALGAGPAREHRMPERAEVQVERHGPYWMLNVEPPVPPQADGMSPAKYVLCRCGLSGNKPFCDGTHRDRKWRDDQE